MSAVVNSMYITPRDYPFALPVSCQKLRMFGNHLYHRGNGMFMLLQGYEFDGCSVKIRLFDTIDIGISDGPLTAEGVPEMFWPSAVHDIGYEFVIELAEHFGLNVWQMRKIIDDAFLEHGKKWSLPGSDREDHYYAAVRKLGWICVLRRYARAVGWVKALKGLALDGAGVEKKMNIPAIPWAKLWLWLKPLLAKLVTDKARDVLGEPQERFFLTRWVTWARNKISGNLYLLTIGQSDFGGAANSLPACRTDAEGMARLYKGYGASVVEKHNIGLADTVKAIRTALAELDDGRTVVIHYSSHGSQIGDRNGDEADRKDEVICASDLGLISDDELYAWCDQAVRERGGDLILVLDTCHSGGMARTTDAAPEPAYHAARFVPESALPEASVAQYLARKHHFPVERATEPPRHTVMMATQENNYAYDGVYTPAWIRAAERGNAKAYDLHLAVKGDLARQRARQVPQFAGEATAKIFG